jgi:hypothetical protein
VRIAIAADVHEMPLRRSGGLGVAENADLEAHAAPAEVRDAQAAMHGASSPSCAVPTTLMSGSEPST